MKRVVEERLRIAEDLPFLEGHFPGLPVVAGVVQVHLALLALGERLGHRPRLSGLEALKFRALLQPGQDVRLSVDLSDDGARFEFELADAERPERVFSSGRGLLRDDR
jgi:3-hydroxyacyl-[acyl-carrier-protein] dehydratase